MPKSNTKARKNYDASFKLQVVLDSLQKDMTIEKVHVKYGISPTVINKWKALFKQNGHLVFNSNITSKTKTQESDSPEFLKKVIGEITVQNEILKKALSVWD
jgi:transposase-like protein